MHKVFLVFTAGFVRLLTQRFIDPAKKDIQKALDDGILARIYYSLSTKSVLHFHQLLRYDHYLKWSRDLADNQLPSCIQLFRRFVERESGLTHYLTWLILQWHALLWCYMIGVRGICWSRGLLMSLPYSAALTFGQEVRWCDYRSSYRTKNGA